MFFFILKLKKINLRSKISKVVTTHLSLSHSHKNSPTWQSNFPPHKSSNKENPSSVPQSVGAGLQNSQAKA